MYSAEVKIEREGNPNTGYRNPKDFQIKVGF